MDRSRLATVQPVLSASTAAFLACCSGSVALGAKTSKTAQAETAPPVAVQIQYSDLDANSPWAAFRPQFADPFPSPAAAVPQDLLAAPELDSLTEAFTQFSLGVLLEESAQPDAPEYLRRAVELDPSNARLAVRLAGDLLREKKTKEATALLKASHQAAPKEMILPVELARVYLAIRQPDNALTYAERAYKLAPGEFAALSTLVDVCTAAKLSQRVEEVLRKTLQLSQKDAAFWLRAGDLFRIALTSRGAQLSKIALERVNRLYGKAMELSPTDFSCLERTADHYSMTQQFADANRFYERAAALFVQENGTTSVSIAEKWARSLILGEDPEAAIDLLENLIQQHPREAEPRNFLGELYLQQGQLVSALGNFKTALDLNPNAPEDHVRLIQLQLRLKRAPDAVESAKLACARFSNAPNLTLLLAVALGGASRNEEALEAFESAEKEFLNTKGAALDAAFYLTYGVAAERAGRLERAEELLQKSAALDPENAAEAFNYLGFMWVEREMRLEEAGVLIRKALGLKPNHPAYLDSLGWWYFRKGDLPGAVRELRRALETIRREDAPEVYEHLGDVLYKMGNAEGALSAWEAALELEPAREQVRGKVQRATAPVASGEPAKAKDSPANPVQAP